MAEKPSLRMKMYSSLFTEVGGEDDGAIAKINRKGLAFGTGN
jgi:hypothetical protein